MALGSTTVSFTRLIHGFEHRYGGADGDHVYCDSRACVENHLETETAIKEGRAVGGAFVIHITRDLRLPEMRMVGKRDKTLEGHGFELRWTDDRDGRNNLFTLHRCRNLIFRGCFFEHDGARSGGADVFFVSDSHHVVWDKCTFDYGTCERDGTTCDESIHMAAPSTFLTVQRTLFLGYVQSMNIKHGSMLGNKGDDQNSLHVTFYECYFKDGHSREPKVDAGRVHMVNCVWFNRDDSSFYGVRAVSTTTDLGTATPEVLVESSYVEAIDWIYRMENAADDDDVGVIAEARCNLDDHSREGADTPYFRSDLTWCVPYDYYRMDPFDCHHVSRVKNLAGAKLLDLQPSPSPITTPRPSGAPTRRPTSSPTTPRPTPVAVCPKLCDASDPGAPCLWKVSVDGCPDEAVARKCDAALAIWDACEGDGECSTDKTLNNCPGPRETPATKTKDVYRLMRCPPLCGSGAEPCLSPATACPESTTLQTSCAFPYLKEGDFCEADGECGTDPNLDNCDGADGSKKDYYRYGPAPRPTTPGPTRRPTPAGEWHKNNEPTQDCAWAAAHAPRCDARGWDGRFAWEACEEVVCSDCDACPAGGGVDPTPAPGRACADPALFYPDTPSQNGDGYRLGGGRRLAAAQGNPYGIVGFAAWFDAGITYGGFGGIEVRCGNAMCLEEYVEDTDGPLIIHITADSCVENKFCVAGPCCELGCILCRARRRQRAH